eukprot:TCALIF_06709-PA protein Name:"Similar to Trypsin (Phaedon cochleariae)" AED:0.06 eAED:0.06 QI:4/1/1/1/0.3/0.36/11/0/449
MRSVVTQILEHLRTKMQPQVPFLKGIIFCLVTIYCVHGADVILSCEDSVGLNALGDNDRYVIQSHDFSMSQFYDGPQRCSYKVRKQGRCSQMRLNCPTFELEESDNCTRDFVRIRGQDFDFSDDVNLNNGRLCGTVDIIEVFSTGRWFNLTFKTNRRNNNFNGFQCFISCADNLPSTTQGPVTETPEPCKCGETNRMSRIQGGENTQVNEYPWQTLVQIITSATNAYFCGGSLISDRHVLTSAHCFLTPNLNLTHSVSTLSAFGLHDLQDLDITTSLFALDKMVTLHPDYNELTLDNDFAIVELKGPINFSDFPNIRPICLPVPGHELPLGSEAITTGWGATGGASNSILQAATVSTISSSDCQQELQYTITNNMMCAESTVGGQGPCSGDQGGPMISNEANENYYELVGVSSFGPGCTVPEAPFVYSNVSAALDWILSEIGTPSCERP